jgi:hypothetical protein
MVEIEPIKTCRRVAHIDLRRWRKDSRGDAAADRELRSSKVGRKARVKGEAEPMAPRSPQVRPGWLDAKGQALRNETYETARLRFPGYGIQLVESGWQSWAVGKASAHDPDRAYLLFLRSFVEKHPL